MAVAAAAINASAITAMGKSIRFGHQVVVNRVACWSINQILLETCLDSLITSVVIANCSLVASRLVR